MPRKTHIFFGITFGIYVVLGLFNLAYLPVAWTDEVMNLDPAFQLWKHGEYRSLLWPNPGADIFFLSYPPLLQFFHAAWMVVLPVEVFWMRLPLFLIHCGTLYLLYILLRKLLPNNGWLAFLFFALFAFDKVVFEISRSMRVEVLECFLLATLIYFEAQNRSVILRGLLVSFILAAHIKLWPLVAVWWIWEMGKKQTIIAKIWGTFAALLLPLLFLIYIQWDLSELYRQLFLQVEKHTNELGVLQKIQANFFGRFWPVYKEQPWVILFHFVMWIAAFSTFWRKDIWMKKIATMFLVTSLVWLFLLAPHYRYWPPLYLLGIVLLASSFTEWFSNKRLLIYQGMMVIVAMAFVSFAARHSIAFLQRKARCPIVAKEWLNNAIHQKDSTLLIGESLGFYYVANKKNMDYGIDFYPQHLHFNQYKAVYFLTHEKPALELISEYRVATVILPSWMSNFGKGNTYNGTRLYRIANEQQWKLVTDKYQEY